MSDETTAVEETEEAPTVRSFRHKAKDAVRSGKVREALRKLDGRGGVSQEEQVTNLTEARDLLEEAKAESSLDEAIAVLNEAIEFAGNRDFEAHQEAKAARKAAFYGSEVEEDDADLDDEEDDEDPEA